MQHVVGLEDALYVLVEVVNITQSMRLEQRLITNRVTFKLH